MNNSQAGVSSLRLTHIIYGLYATSPLFGVTALVAIVMNYIKRNDVAGTVLESHFRWQIRTFWFALLWAVIGVATFLAVIGWFVLVSDLIWFIYRITKGWLALNDGKPIYPSVPKHG